MASLTVAGVAYLLSVLQLMASPRLPRHLLVIGLGLAAVWQLEFLRLPTAHDDDVHRYVWDGRLQRLGYNPYLVIPGDPAVNALHTTETHNLNNPDLPSPYPPGAQIFFRAVATIHESTQAMRIAFVLCAWATAFLLLDWLRLKKKRSHLVLAYAWNPLLAIEVAGSGHIDIVGAMLLVLSAVALLRRLRTLAAIGLALAIAVKILPIVLLPLYWKRIRIRDAALGIVLVALLCLPFLDHGHFPIGSLGTYVQGFRFNGPLFMAFDKLAPPQLLVVVAILVGFVTSAWLRRSERAWSPGSFAWPMAASLLFAPVVFPWYLLWLLPFLISRSSWLIAVWTVSIIPTYLMWHLRAQTGVWGSLPVWVMALEYGLLLLAALLMSTRRTPQEPKIGDDQTTL